jgi:hypothetical protein
VENRRHDVTRQWRSDQGFLIERPATVAVIDLLLAASRCAWDKPPMDYWLVDEAGDLLAFPGGDLPRHQRRGTDRRQRRQEIRQRAVGLVHLVDEEGVRHAQPLQFAQRRLQQGGLGRIGLGDDDRHVHRRQRRVDIGAEFQGAWAVDDGVAIAHEVEAGEVQLNRVAARAGLGT